MIRVGFTMIGSHEWLGGRNYLRNLLAVVNSELAGRIEPILLTALPADHPEIAELGIPSEQVVTHPLFDRVNLRRRAKIAFLSQRDRAVERAFAAQHVDVVFEVANFYGRRFGIPTLAWYADFQHRHLPHMFPLYQRWQRDLIMHGRGFSRRTIMLSSEEARMDCERFYPSTSGRTVAVPFAIADVPAPAAELIEEVRQHYAHGQPYLFMPNQFWQHKNQKIVVDALISMGNTAPLVIATGAHDDPRRPGWFSEVRIAAEKGGVGSHFITPGAIPYAHVAALMAGATALINPSRFEGWSTTVEEAKALGVPMLLSAINVHREQAPDGTLFFEPNSPASLAQIMRDVDIVAPTDPIGRAVVAHDDQKQRISEFANRFEAALTTALRNH